MANADPSVDISAERPIVGLPQTLNALIGVTPTTVQCNVSPTFPGGYVIQVPNTVTLIAISPQKGQSVFVDNTANSSDVAIATGGGGSAAIVLAGGAGTVVANGTSWFGGDTQGGVASNPLFASARVTGAVDTNVPNLAAFAVSGAGRDGITYVQGQIVLLINQTQPTQNGPYVVGAVNAGNAPLTRPGWWETGSVIPLEFEFAIGPAGTTYGGLKMNALGSGIVDTGSPTLRFRDGMAGRPVTGAGSFQWSKGGFVVTGHVAAGQWQVDAPIGYNLQRCTINTYAEAGGAATTIVDVNVLSATRFQVFTKTAGAYADVDFLFFVRDAQL